MNKFQMIEDFILFVLAGHKVDAMIAMREMNKRWDILWDWHDFSNVLDRLDNHDKVNRTGIHRGGFVLYKVPGGAGNE
jgi:hypothetical protein